MNLYMQALEGRFHWPFSVAEARPETRTPSRSATPHQNPHIALECRPTW
jgi:hypothetical protein